MFRPISLFTRLYGANPPHLLAMLGCFALVVYSSSLALDEPMFTRMLVWFGAAVLAHDLVLLPACSLADRALTATTNRRHGRSKERVSVINHVRIPVLASGLLFLLFFPGILQQGSETYLAATGQDQQPFLGRWLVLSGVFVAASAALYILRLTREHLRRRQSKSADRPRSGS